MAGSILGNRVLRKEDPKFLTTGGVYVDDLDEPLLAGAVHVTYVRSAVAHGTILSIDVAARGHARRGRRLHRRASASSRSRPPSTRWSPAAAGHRQGPLRRRARRRRRHRDAAQASDAAEQVIVDYDVLPALVDIEAALASEHPDLRGAGSNVGVRHQVLGMPENHRRRLLRGLRGRRHGPLRQPARRPCPLEVRGSAAAWVDGRLHQWLSHPARPGRQGPDRRRERRRARPGARDHPRRRRRLRRQDRLRTPRRSSSGRCRRARPPGALARDPQRVDDGARPRPRPGAVRHDRRHPRRQGHALPAARPRRTPAPSPRWAAILARS